MRVGYYIPAYRDDVDRRVWRQGVLEGMACAREGIELCPDSDNTNGVDLARNRSLEGARVAGLDYLFMQDNDTFCEVAIIPRLVQIAQAHDAAIVAVGYALRRTEQVASVYPLKMGEVYEGHLAGTGLMLIDLKQVEQVAEQYSGPWFARGYDERGTQLRGGGDIHFCELMSQHGHSVWLDTTLTTGHREVQILTFDPADSGGKPLTARAKAVTPPVGDITGTDRTAPQAVQRAD